MDQVRMARLIKSAGSVAQLRLALLRQVHVHFGVCDMHDDLATGAREQAILAYLLMQRLHDLRLHLGALLCELRLLGRLLPLRLNPRPLPLRPHLRLRNQAQLLGVQLLGARPLL